MGSEGRTPEVVVEALGVPVGIPVSGEDAVRLRHQWVRALTDREPTVVIDVDELDTADLAARDYAITGQVTMAALGATAGQRINLHAGAVADDRGRALAVIGPSGSGKTTAISLLGERLGYLTDETVSLDEALVIHDHPKPLSLVTDVDAPREKHSVSPDDLGLLFPPEVSRLHRIVLLHRGQSDVGLVPITPARAIAEMVEQTSSLVHVPHPVHRLAHAIDTCGGVWSLEYAEFADRLDDVVGLLDREPREPDAHVHHPSVPGTSDDPVPGAWSRAPWTDAEEYDDELVLMIGDRVHVLAGLGVVLWLALTAPRTADELVASAQARWGEHPDAVDLVADALAVLAGQEMLHPPA